jgi:hypothetical protein
MIDFLMTSLFVLVIGSAVFVPFGFLLSRRRKYWIIALVLVAASSIVSNSEAKECWWQGNRLVCAYPENRPFWWDDKREQKYREHEWRRHRDLPPGYWDHNRR